MREFGPYLGKIGRQSWDGPRPCKDDECTGSANHFHCDGPLKGDRVRFVCRASDEVVSGESKVIIHWHYEGCMIRVDALPENKSLCPALGDEVFFIRGVAS